MNFKIHRGANEIGGSCLEIWTDNSTIVVDFGMPLVNIDRTKFNSKNISELIEKGTLPNIPNLYKSNNSATLILSHAHQDHYGLMNYLHADCKVYLGKATQKLIELTNTFTNKKWKIESSIHFESGKSFNIGSIEITPYLMDHSAFDAYAFLIKADGKSLFYSGDFRIHGRKAKIFDWLSHNIATGIDYLLLEGTTIGRSNQKFPTETEIENEFHEIFKEKRRISLIYTSGQNIDRLVSIYRACKKAGKILAIDFYIATILKELAKLGAKLPFPSDNFSDIKVFFPNRLSKMISSQGNEKILYQFKEYKITREEIDKDFSKIVMIVRPSMIEDLKKLNNINNGIFIYSMWSGYKKEPSTKKFIDFLTDKGMAVTDVHTSGHADSTGLKRMVKILKPKNIIPIHTFERESYKEIFTESNIIVLEDGEQIKA